jgi:nucleoside-diphosphate-sugar epimerase
MTGSSGSRHRTIAVTGATGLIGHALCEWLASRGWMVRALARRVPPRPWPIGVSFFRCNLPGYVDTVALDGCDAVIHAAYATRATSRKEAQDVNEEGTRRIVELSRAAGVERLLFISSMSAHDQARSYYGASKRKLEGLFDPARDLVIRPGLVLGSAGGLFGSMENVLRSSRIVPLIGGGRQPLQTIHIDDLCEGISSALDLRVTGRVTLAEPKAISMQSFLRLLAERVGRRPIFVRVPATPVLWAARGLEAIGIAGPLSSENILGLQALREADCTADLGRLRLHVRSARESLHDLAGKA